MTLVCEAYQWIVKIKKIKIRFCLQSLTYTLLCKPFTQLHMSSGRFHSVFRCLVPCPPSQFPKWSVSTFTKRIMQVSDYDNWIFKSDQTVINHWRSLDSFVQKEQTTMIIWELGQLASPAIHTNLSGILPCGIHGSLSSPTISLFRHRYGCLSSLIPYPFIHPSI